MMDWSAVALEAGLVALAVVILSIDLVLGRDRAPRTGLYGLALAGLPVILGASFRIAVGGSFTAAWFQDPRTGLKWICYAMRPAHQMSLYEVLLMRI